MWMNRWRGYICKMGGADSKLNFRQAVVQLTSKKTVSYLFNISEHQFSLYMGFMVLGMDVLMDFCTLDR